MSETESTVTRDESDTDMDTSTSFDQDREGDTVKKEAVPEDEKKPSVPSLLDLNFTVKEDEQKNNGGAEEESNPGEPTEIPFKLKKKHLFTAHRLHYSMKSVIVKPFKPDLFSSTTVQWWLKRASEFSVRSSWNGTSAGVFVFKTYAEAASAIKEIKTYVLGSIDGEVEVRYGLIKPDLPYRYPCDEVNYLIRDGIEQPLMTRVLVLEGVPSNTTEEDLQTFFVDAKSIIFLTHDEEYKGFALIEFAASHKMREAMNDYKKDGKEFGSVIEVKGEEVMLGKFMSRYNQAMSWLRSHPPKGDKEVELSDEDRVSTCEKLKDLLEVRDTVLDGEEDSSEEKVATYWRLSETLENLARDLRHDTERRKQEGKKFPESKDLKINPVAIFGHLDEEDEEITASSGKVPSLLEINPYGSGAPQSLLGKRVNNSVAGPTTKVPLLGSWPGCYDDGMSADVHSTTDMLSKCVYDVSGGQGYSSSNVHTLATSIQKATEVLENIKKNPKNILSGPLETTRYCKVPLPLKKSLVSRSSTVKERLYITAYPRKFDDRVLEDILCRFGGLIDAYFSKGSNYGYAKFADRTSAQNAIVILNDQVVAGSRIQLRKAETPGSSYRHGRRSWKD